MATVGEFIVRIGANIRRFVKGMTEARNTMEQTGRAMQETADQMEGDFHQMGQSSRYMDEVTRQTREMNRALHEASKAMSDQYAKLVQDQNLYKNNHDGLISKLQELGQQQKAISDQMIANNEAMKASFFQSAGSILAASNMSDKLATSIQNLGNPIQALDPLFLKISSRFEDMAKSGNAAVLALQKLGPTASMKELLDLQRQITMMAGGAQTLQVGAGIVTVAEIAALVALSNHIDGRLIPAFERFKEVWTEALTPFIKAFTTAAEAVINFGTRIGEFFAQLAQTNPVLSAMIFGFLALIPPLTMLLAPLAVGIGYLGGMRAMFALLWAAIKPVAIAFFSIIGTVMLVSAAIVSLIAAWNQMMTHSQALRTAVSTAWMAIKTAIMNAIAPLGPAWERLKAAFLNMMATFLGGEPTMSSIWQKIGDAAAKFFNWFTANAVPVIEAAVQGFVAVFTFLMDMVVMVFNGISEFWRQWGGTIMGILQPIWDNIVMGIRGALQAIQNVFLLVMNVLSGNWSAAWQNIKNIVTGVLMALYAYFMTWGLGRVVKLFGDMFKSLLGVVKQSWNTIKSAYTDALTAIFNTIKTQWTNIQTSTKTVWTTIETTLKNFWTRIQNAVTAAWGQIWSTLSGYWDKIALGFAGLVSSAYNWGSNLMSEFISGVSSMVSRLWDTLTGIMETVQGFLGFYSPSELGPGRDADIWAPNLMKMYADGIKGGIPAIQKAVGQVAGILNPVPAPALSAASTGNMPTVQPSGGHTFNITINGSNADEIWEKLERQLARRGVRY